MSEAFITRRGGSFFSYFAAVSVTYPSGSTCTCTKGTNILTTKGDTSGSYMFIIPEAGTWTVSCTNGTKSKSETVSISRYGQVETVVLSYSLEILSKTSGLANPYYVSGKSIMPAVDVTPYSTMTVVGKRTYALQSSYTIYCFLSKTKDGDSGNYIVINTNSEKTYTLNISSLTGTYYFTTEGNLSKSGNKLISNLNDAVKGDIYSIVFS